MASSQQSRSIQTQLEGKISNNLVERLNYEEKYIWENKNSTIEYPNFIDGKSNKNFYENNPTPIGGSFKAALVYKFAIDGKTTQYCVFAWHSPAFTAHSTNKVFTKIVANKNDINWGEIEKELDNSTNESKFVQGIAVTYFTAPKVGLYNFNATIQYLAL